MSKLISKFLNPSSSITSTQKEVENPEYKKFIRKIRNLNFGPYPDWRMDALPEGFYIQQGMVFNADGVPYIPKEYTHNVEGKPYYNYGEPVVLPYSAIDRTDDVEYYPVMGTPSKTIMQDITPPPEIKLHPIINTEQYKKAQEAYTNLPEKVKKELTDTYFNRITQNGIPWSKLTNNDKFYNFHKGMGEEVYNFLTKYFKGMTMGEARNILGVPDYSDDENYPNDYHGMPLTWRDDYRNLSDEEWEELRLRRRKNFLESRNFKSEDEYFNMPFEELNSTQHGYYSEDEIKALHERFAKRDHKYDSELPFVILPTTKFKDENGNEFKHGGKLIPKAQPGYRFPILDRNQIQGMNPLNSSTNASPQYPEGYTNANIETNKKRREEEKKRKAEEEKRKMELMTPSVNNNVDPHSGQILTHNSENSPITSAGIHKQYQDNMKELEKTNPELAEQRKLEVRENTGLGLSMVIDPIGTTSYLTLDNSPKAFGYDFTVTDALNSSLQKYGVSPFWSNLLSIGITGYISGIPRFIPKATGLDRKIASAIPEFDNIVLYNNHAAPIIQDFKKANPGVEPTFTKSRKFKYDILFHPQETRVARETGNYPLTFGERRSWISNVKNDVEQGVKFVADESKTLPQVLKIADWRILYHPEDFNLSYGTKKAVDVKGRWPSLEDLYLAFEKNGQVYVPFRTNKYSLLTNALLGNTSDRINLGAHEFLHVVQGMHETPLVFYDENGVGKYRRYTNTALTRSLYDAAESIIKKAGTKGEWPGSLAEMDAELKAWRAIDNLSKYFEMEPVDQLMIINKANKRFGLPITFTPENEARKIKSLNLNLPEAESWNMLNNNIKQNLNNELFHKLFTELETNGYKNGGKIYKYFKQ